MSSRLPATPISVVPTQSELKDGRLNQRNLEIAIRALSRDGLVVLEDMVDHATLDHLNVEMVKDAYELQARKDSPFNYNKGNIQQDPPLTKEWFSDGIYLRESSSFLYWSILYINLFRSYSDPGHVDCFGPHPFTAVRVR